MAPYLNDKEISIHAPREGSDQIYLRWISRISNFNPRSP